MSPESVINKIRGLLAKAESTEYEAEAEALLDKATSLMASHRVSEAMLAEAGKAAEDPMVVQKVTIGTWTVSKTHLLINIGQAFGCHTTRESWGNKKALQVIGHQSDVETVVALMTHLEIQLDRALLAQKGWDKGDTRRVRANFARAWCLRVAERVEEHYATAVKEAVQDQGGSSSSVALVLRDRSLETDDFFEETQGYKPRYRTSNLNLTDRSAFGAGRAAGNRADIGAGRLGGSRGSLSA